MSSSFESSFPNTPRRKNSIESVWNKFSSPYDHSDTIDYHRTFSTEPRLLRYKRIARSFPPAAPKMTRSTSLPRHKVSSSKAKKLNFHLFTPRLSPTIKHNSDDQAILSASKKNMNKDEMMTRERLISRSAEVLDDDFELIGSSCNESKMHIWQVCKSSEELEVSQDHCLIDLEQMRMCGTSSTDEFINFKPYPMSGSRMSASQVEEHADSLRKSSNKMDHNEVPCVMKNSDLLHNQDIMSCKTDQQYYDENTDETEQEKNKDRAGQDNKVTTLFVVSGNRDHPPITVRPGVSLDNFRSSRSQTGKFVVSPESYTSPKRNRSTSCDLANVKETFPDSNDSCDIDRTESKSRGTADKSCRKKEYRPQFHDIPQMPDLSLAKYNLGDSFRSRDMRKAISTYQHSLMETCSHRLFAEATSCSPPCAEADNGRIIIDGEDVFTTPILKYPRSNWDPTNRSSVRRLSRLSTSERSRSEERRQSSLQCSLSSQQQGFRHSAEARIPTKYQNPPVSLYSNIW